MAAKKETMPVVKKGNGTKGYTCNKYKNLRIRSKIKFEGGLFVTDDPALQKLIETNDLWQIHIWPRD